MNKKKTQVIISSLMVVSTFMTSVVGQTVAPIKQPASLPSGVTASTAKSSVYLENISRPAAEGQIQIDESLSAEVLKLERALAASDRKGTILVDRYGNEHQAVVQNLAYSLLAENAPAGLRGKRIVKINLGQILADSGDASEGLSPITKIFTAWACW